MTKHIVSVLALALLLPLNHADAAEPAPTGPAASPGAAAAPAASSGQPAPPPPPGPVPAVTQGSLPRSAPDAAPAEEQSPFPDYQLGAGIGLYLAGAGLLVAFNVAAIRVNSLRDDPDFASYREGFPKNLNVCDEAEKGTVSPVPGAASPETVADICKEASSMEVLEVVGGAAGSLLAVVGLVLLGTSDTVSGSDDEKKEASRWSFQVQTAREGAAFGVGYRF
jgi:hypothetical protein